MYARPVPATTADQLKALLRWERGSTRRVAVVLGVSQRTVQRWVACDPGRRGRPSPGHEQRIADLVPVRWQPLIRARRAAAEAGGVVVYTRARFGFQAGPASSDDPRMRRITGRLTGAVTQQIFAALDAGASEKQHELILGRALGHLYFREAGHRAHGLHVTLGDIDFIEFGLQ
ncbi:helix-turn-helix domain-containing protein [Streptomyces sp. NPDC000075]|uniref:telomere-protecting terminal protein Tpg n=1 Tax=Streptomyces TaxID=1883 RepID=UPI0031D3CA20